MPITDEQRRQRVKHIGASDVPVLFNMDPWGRTQRDLWLEKTGQIDMTGPDDMSEAADVGNMVEEPLVRWTAGVTGHNFRMNQRRVNGVIAGNIDGLSPDGLICEAKSTGMTKMWGQTSKENPTDEVPPHVVIQVHAQAVANKRKSHAGYVPFLTRGYVAMERRLYLVEAKYDMLDMVEERCAMWWEHYVVRGNEPPGTPPRLETLRKVIRQPNTWIDLDQGVLDDYQEAMVAAREAKKLAEIKKRELIANLKQCDGGRTPATEVLFLESPGRVTYGKTDKYEHHCPECGVGHKQGKATRNPSFRKRTIDG